MDYPTRELAFKPNPSGTRLGAGDKIICCGNVAHIGPELVGALNLSRLLLAVKQIDTLHPPQVIERAYDQHTSATKYDLIVITRGKIDIDHIWGVCDNGSIVGLSKQNGSGRIWSPNISRSSSTVGSMDVRRKSSFIRTLEHNCGIARLS
jgi:hypothetical protein